MNSNSKRLAGSARPATQPCRKSNFAVWLAGVGGAAAVLSVLIYQAASGLGKHNAALPASPEPVTSQDTATAEPVADTTRFVQKKVSADVETLHKPVGTENRRAKGMGSVELAQQLIGRLAQVDVSKDNLTSDGAKDLNEAFKQLVAQGPAGIPAIRAFLEKKQDVNFGKFTGGIMVDYPTMRLGLIDALKEIGGPEAMALAAQTLRTTGDPLELAVLSRDLEQQAPGEYRQQAVTAAAQSLSQALGNGLGERDIAPLFQVLESYGDASAVPVLEKAFSQWSYYSAIALANVPGGEGIPALARLAQDPTATANGQNEIALRMLAQVSGDNSQAAEALLQLARNNQISGTAWSGIASGLAGYNLELGTPLVNRPTTPLSGPGLQYFHIEEGGGQNVFTTPLSASWLDQQVNSRIQLVDQLIAANPAGASIEDLQQARASLSKMAATLAVVPH